MYRTLPRMYSRLHEGINYHLRALGNGRWAQRCRPVSIGFMLTNLCNARCVHCDIWKNKGKEGGPSFEQWKQVLKDLRAWLGTVWIYFSGGEALILPWAPELVAYASELGLLVELLTHGYWDDQSRIERVATANPSRVTVSLDGIGETHDKIRGRNEFFQKTTRSIATLQRVRKEQDLGFTIRLKCVLMSHNLHDAANIAEFADQPGMEVFFQPIEQNYNTPEDPEWFKTSTNWPSDPQQAVATVQKLIALKRCGLPIANSHAQLEAMVPYFGDPVGYRVATQMHSAHEKGALCAALTNLQLMPNGDVLTCFRMSPVGNIKNDGIRQVWEGRPKWWLSGCCLGSLSSERTMNINTTLEVS